MTGPDTRLPAVFAAEHERLWRSVLAWSGDPEVASDAVAEAFAQAVRRGTALRDPAAWVWRSAFRIAAGMHAGRRRDGLGAAPPEMAATETLPDEVVTLLDALAGLDERDRRVVVLSLVGGLSSAEVGAVVDASAGAVRVRLHRARSRLRAALAPEPECETAPAPGPAPGPGPEGRRP